MIWDPFGDMDTRGILRNKKGIKNKAKLDTVEYLLIHTNIDKALNVLTREKQIDLRSWRRTHAILFADIYPWAGTIRTQQVERRYRFNVPENVERESNAVFAKTRTKGFLIEHLGEVYGELAFNHPFYDGNGRSLNVVFSEMARREGFGIAWDKFDKQSYLAHLTNAAFGCSYGGLTDYLKSKIIPLEQADPESRLRYSSSPQA
jgi:cell filamentation protein